MIDSLGDTEEHVLQSVVKGVEHSRNGSHLHDIGLCSACSFEELGEGLEEPIDEPDFVLDLGGEVFKQFELTSLDAQGMMKSDPRCRGR